MLIQPAVLTHSGGARILTQQDLCTAVWTEDSGFVAVLHSNTELPFHAVASQFPLWALISNPVLLRTCCVILSKSLDLSESQFPRL